MQANELRVGNYILIEGREFKVMPNDILALYQIVDAGKSNYQFTPIPLTAEILEACGFKEFNKSSTGNRQWWLEENPVTLDFMLVIRFVPEYGFFYGNAFHQVKYVHQLQNLYFALTSKELEVKL